MLKGLPFLIPHDVSVSEREGEACCLLSVSEWRVSEGRGGNPAPSRPYAAGHSAPLTIHLSANAIPHNIQISVSDQHMHAL